MALCHLLLGNWADALEADQSGPRVRGTVDALTVARWAVSRRSLRPKLRMRPAASDGLTLTVRCVSLEKV